MNAKFLDKLDFYEQAYQEELNQAKSIRLNLEKTKQGLTAYIEEKIANWLGDELEEEEHAMIKETGISVSSILADIHKTRKSIPLEIDKIRNSEFYQKYLEMTIQHDFSIIFELEADATFAYLIRENFHNTKFYNSPKIKIPLLGTFQPRFKKFAKIANVVSKRHRFDAFKEMFSTWETMRGAFREVVGERPVQEAKSRFEELQIKIKEKNEELNNLAHKEIDLIVQRVGEFIINAKSITLKALTRKELEYIETQKEKIKLEDQSLILSQNTVNQILKNMGFVHDISVNAHKVATNPTIKGKLEEILKIDDPTQDLYEILPKEDWQKALDAFQEYDKKHFKNAKVHYDQAEYSVTDLTPEQIQYLMKKYNVKEGEAFEPDPEDIRKLKLMGNS